MNSPPQVPCIKQVKAGPFVRTKVSKNGRHGTDVTSLKFMCNQSLSSYVVIGDPNVSQLATMTENASGKWHPVKI